ncbi:uncharacterized protein NEMAJ01_1634 [Nematocida major]|uniref:uncharacterized protein n=1 Tax=Nematocida major TaxID=1912982 RepID=UPI0020080938|nr:uncharacterized protein NEMAJ01_1634 [Nematocida major]KAH9386738.1 hypothetical protein NEMAJ01_1634 [Nematocida major]
MLDIQKDQLLSDLFFSLVGLECSSVRVRKGQAINVQFNSLIPKDDLQIVSALLSIIVGVRQCRYKIDEAYFSGGTIRKCLFKGIEEELDAFARKVDEVRRSAQGIDLRSLPFIFQGEIELFSGMINMLRETESVNELFLLDVVLRSRIVCLPAVLHLVPPMNRVLTCLVEGRKTDGYFEERHSYDYSECFWSNHYRVKEAPPCLAQAIGTLMDLGKISKIRRAVNEARIEYSGSVLSVRNGQAVVCEAEIGAYASALSDCPAVRAAWTEGVSELFAKIGLDVSKYSEMFKELGEKMFCVPSRKDMSFVNYIMRKGSPGYTPFEAHVDSPRLSFLEDSSFLLEKVEGVRASPVSFVYNEVSLPKALLGIYDTRTGKCVAGLSLLQGLDISFALKEPVSMFFSAKSVSELKILFRLIYSLYAVEHFSCAQYSHWRIKHILLSFVTGIRMCIAEKIDAEFQRVVGEKNIAEYTPALESALYSITKASLLTSPFLMQFYSRVFSIAFMYIEMTNREQLTREETDEIVASLKKCFRAALPYVKSPILLALFESLA